MKRFATTLILFFLGITILQAQNKTDVVDIRLMDPQSCCFEMFLENSHTPVSPLNFLQLRILTNGVEFQPGAGGPWPSTNEADMVLFGEHGIILNPREMIEGFNFCFEFVPGQPRTVSIEWQTQYNGTEVNTDTVSLDCTFQVPVCDTISVGSITIPSQPEGTCCYEFTLKNQHEPVGELNGFGLVIQTPGATIAGTPTGPWPIEQITSTAVTFGTTTSPLASGADLRGFRICVLAPQGAAGDIVLKWISSLDGRIFCEEILS